MNTIRPPKPARRAFIDKWGPKVDKALMRQELDELIESETLPLEGEVLSLRGKLEALRRARKALEKMDEGSDNTVQGNLNNAGFGSGGAM